MEKNLSNEDALKKFQKLINEINVCMFITNKKEQSHTRPMATIEVEQNGTLWFFTDIRSFAQIRTQNFRCAKDIDTFMFL